MEAARARHLNAARVFAAAFHALAVPDRAAVHIERTVCEYALTARAAAMGDLARAAVEQRERAALRNVDHRAGGVSQREHLVVQAEHRAVLGRPRFGLGQRDVVAQIVAARSRVLKLVRRGDGLGVYKAGVIVRAPE